MGFSGRRSVAMIPEHLLKIVLRTRTDDLVHPATEYLQTRKGQQLSAVNSPCGGF